MDFVSVVIFVLYIFLNSFQSCEAVYQPDNLLTSSNLIPRRFLTQSVSVNGSWEISRQPEIDCKEHFLCTKANRTWQANNFKFYDNVTGCDALLSKGIKKIYFHGDSYMRQIYAGMLISLKNDYQYGSIKDPKASSVCEYQRQFFEKKCGLHSLNHEGYICDGKILLDPMLNELYSLSHCPVNENSIVLFSFGNHKTERHAPFRNGINNATLYSEFFEAKTCPSILANSNNNISVWWVPTHFRIIGHFGDETAEMVDGYNEGMRSFFNSGKCGNVSYVDTFNMTKALVQNHLDEAKDLSYDMVGTHST